MEVIINISTKKDFNDTSRLNGSRTKSLKGKVDVSTNLFKSNVYETMLIE